MILVNFKKINTNFKKILEIYSNITNFQNLECPHCHSHDIILWGSYERGALIPSNGINKKTESHIIRIQRVKCKSCGKTHALLPLGIIPYKQVTTELMIQILLNIINSSIEKTASLFFMDFNLIKKYWYDFQKKHLPLLKTFFRHNELSKTLLRVSISFIEQIDYIIKTGLCFMQIKLGIIGVSPLHEGAPT